MKKKLKNALQSKRLTLAIVALFVLMAPIFAIAEPAGVQLQSGNVEQTISSDSYQGIVAAQVFETPQVKDWDNINFVNPSFEYPNVGPTGAPDGVTPGQTPPFTRGGNFEYARLTAQNQGFQTVHESLVPGWRTVAVDPARRNVPSTTLPEKVIDIMLNGAILGPGPDRVLVANSGTQSVELSGWIPSIFFQDAATTPGQTIYYEFYHRARRGSHPAHVDRMDFFLYGVPDNEDYDWPKMPELTNGNPNLIQNMANPIFDPPSVETAISNNLAWYRFAGAYTVPYGQYLTRFAFQGTRSTTGTGGIGNLMEGNLLDDIRLLTPSFVELEKTSSASGGTYALQGERVTYTIIARNIGEADASRALLTDVLPEGVSFVPGSIRINGDPAGEFGTFDTATRTVSVDIGGNANIGPSDVNEGIIEGAQVVRTSGACNDAGCEHSECYETIFSYVTVTFQVDVTADAGSIIQNQARITYDDFTFEEHTDGGYWNVSPVNEFNVRQRTLSGLVWADLNEDGMMDAVGTPAYEVRLSGIIVTLYNDALGTPALDVNGNPLQTTTGPDGSFSFSTIPSGVYRVVATLPTGYQVTPTLGDNLAVNVSNSATIANVALNADLTITYEQVVTSQYIGILPIPAFAASKTASVGGGSQNPGTESNPVPVSINATMTYFVTVTNNTGHHIMREVTVVDDLPAGLEYLESSHSGVRTTFNGGTRDRVTWQLPNLPPGDTVLTVTVLVTEENRSEQIRNTAVASMTGQENVNTNRTYHEVASGYLIKTYENASSTDSVNRTGDTLIYTISVRNTGTITWNPGNITDVLPAGVDFVSAAVTGLGISAIESNGIVTIATENIPAGTDPAVAVATITVTVNDSASGTTITNVVVAETGESGYVDTDVEQRFMPTGLIVGAAPITTVTAICVIAGATLAINAVAKRRDREIEELARVAKSLTKY